MGPTSSPPPAPTPPTVTLVERDPAVLSAMKFALEIEGYEVAAFHSSEAFLAAIEHGGVPGDCMVIDYGMPGIGGLELIRRLRARHVDVPAIVVSGDPRARVRDAVVRAGIPFVHKPLLGGTLSDAIREALRAAPPGGPGRPA